MRTTHDSFAVRPVFASLKITCLAAMAMWATGCQVAPKPPAIVAVPAQSFVQQWSAPLPKVKNDPIVSMYLRGDTIYAYAKSNQVYGFSAAGGKLVFSDVIVGPTSPLRAPTLLPDNKVVFPAADTLEEYDKSGRRLQSIPLDKPTHSSGIAVGYIFYVGLDSPTGGRLAALDLTPRVPTPDQIASAKKLNVPLDSEINRISTKWEVLTIAGIQAAPVFYQGVIYAGSVDGKVWAINEEGSGIWSLPDGSHVFRAAGPIHADLKADDVGLYVASEDGTLYCIDRGSGRMKWKYFADAQLDIAPAVTATTVYQAVPGAGLAAIDKHALGIAQAKWVNSKATRFLAEDSLYVYAQQDDGALIALDKNDGHQIFHGVRHDLKVLAEAEGGKSPIIYAASADGTILSVIPMLRPGTMGELVLNSLPLPFRMWFF